MNTRASVVVAALVALLVQGTVFFLHSQTSERPLSTADTSTYVRAAQELRGDPEAYADAPDLRATRTPGYPALMAACFELGLASPDDLRGVVLVQLLLAAAAAALAAAVAAALVGAGGGLLAGTVSALEPALLAHANVALSEALYGLCLVLLVALGCALALRPTLPRWLALALVTGAAPLVRPVAMLLPLVGAGLLAFGFPRGPGGRRGAVLFLLLAALPCLLWTFRNHQMHGVAQLTRQSHLQQAIFAHEVAQRAGATSPAQEPVWDFQYGRAEGLSLAEIDARRSHYFRTTVLRHLPEAFVLVGVNLAKTAATPAALLPSLLEPERSPPPRSVRERLRWLASLGPLGALLVASSALALAALVVTPWLLWTSARRGAPVWRAVPLLVVLLLYNLGLAALVSGQGARYRAPLAPLFAVAVAVAGVELWRVLCRRQRPRARPSAGRGCT